MLTLDQFQFMVSRPGVRTHGRLSDAGVVYMVGFIVFGLVEVR